MRSVSRLAACVLLSVVVAPATIHHANDADTSKSEQKQEAQPSGVRQLTEEELSTARAALADLTPEQRVVINHLRYLLRPQYEDELMAGRAFAACALPPYEQPSGELDKPGMLRLWAILASGMPASQSTKQWLRLFLAAPIPSDKCSLSEYALHLGVCTQALRRTGLDMAEELRERADDVLDAALKLRHVTDENSPLISGNTIDPRWYGNQVWRAVICRFAKELGLRFSDRSWETALRDLIGAAGETSGWTSKPASNSEAEDLDTNLLAIATLSLANDAPGDTLGKGVSRSIEKTLEDVPVLLRRLDTDYAGSPLAGTRLALIRSFAANLAPQGHQAQAWRKEITNLAIEGHDPSGMVRNAGQLSRTLDLADRRSALAACDAALECLAFSGGLVGNDAPLADLTMAEVAHAMHACSVLHAKGLPEGVPRVFTGYGHELPEPGEIQSFMLKGIEYLVMTQETDGGWGAAWGSNTKGVATDPGTTAFAGMALMRAGNTPFAGKHKDTVLKATKYVVDAVERAAEEGPRITSAEGTQLQRKLGQIVDTAVAAQFLARALPQTECDRKLHTRVEAALYKCLRKIEDSQGEDGGWITAGWAPVLQSAMNNQALELAVLAGCEVDTSVLARSREYLGRDVVVDKGSTTSGKGAASAGVAFYSGAAAFRSAAGDAAEVTMAMSNAKNVRALPEDAEVSDKNLRAIGYTDEKASAKATAFQRYETLLAKLEDENYLKGFGNNGGEEFISYMLSTESVVITGDESWEAWNEKMHTMFEKIQNTDGSWSGHHCITSPVLCTAAVLMCLTADREVHVLVEEAPPLKHSTSSGDSKKKDGKKSEGPLTGD
ncbi:MAG: hypothetical protein H6839_16980 [Planctomycetes bacterium]|nr:hypothetical protein [Planctomycetota bacterium]